MYNGQDKQTFYQQEREQRSLKRQKTAEKDLQLKYIQTTQLRKGRLDKLKQLTDDSKEEEQAKQLLKAQFLIPDGPVEMKRKNGGNGEESLMMIEAAEEANDTATSSNNNNSDSRPTAAAAATLPFHRSCYVCKTRFQQLHFFYDQLCPTCASLNLQKRNHVVDCSNKVALITGARVKIGYHVCLKLLRAKATVVATSRFPNAAVQNFQREPDFDEFSERLHVYGLDLRDVTGLEAFTRYLKLKFSQGIDILINNACQTVRRPVKYYVPLVQQEQELWSTASDSHKARLMGCVEFERIRRQLDVEQHSSAAAPMLETESTKMLVDEERENGNNSSSTPSAALIASSTSVSTSLTTETTRAPFESSGLSHSAAMSQTILLPEDAGVSDAVLPPGVTDINGHQMDLRTSNSWLLKMEEVSTPEIMECMFINAIAPFVLNSRLKPLMCTPNTEDRPDRYIINVSAMEGKFYRYKMPNHPHTNMAKAALNMLTRTSAEDLATKHRIYMNSVDTGWINDENPLERAKKTQINNNFQTPIDEIDAAARILDPVFTGIAEGKKQYGCFLKDYHESEW